MNSVNLFWGERMKGRGVQRGEHLFAQNWSYCLAGITALTVWSTF